MAASRSSKKKQASSLLASAETKLASSGLTLAQGEALGMYTTTASSLDPQFYPVDALVLPYFDLEGQDTGFYRLRYLGELPGFAGALEKPQRYAQLKGTLNWVYVPRLPDFNWPAIAADPSIPLIITEGELKAACACARGFPTLALGGVTVWQSSKKQVPLLDPLGEFEWRQRPVYIIFDSDAASNPDVARAQLVLANMLHKLGALPSVCTLPPSDTGAKQGLDDFLVAGGSLDAVLLEGRQLALAEAVLKLNDRFAYVCDQDVVIEVATARRLKRDGFINGLLANSKVVEYVDTKNGPKRTELSVPREWLAWANRRDVGTLVYEPGQAAFVGGNLNLWKGWGCEPVKGDVSPWVALLDFLFNGFAEERVWFERWCAYPLQHPGAKLAQAVVLWGPEKGTGKSLVGVLLGRLYGKNYTVIKNKDLHGNFNEWADGRQFIMGEEITGSDRRHEADELKALITQEKLRINMKHLPTYEVNDHTNYYFNSNHPDAFFIDDKERRYFIHRVPTVARERAFYIKIVDWMNSGGPAALFHHLLHLPLGDFDPNGPAPITTAKLEMVDHGKSDIAVFTSNLLENLESELERLKQLLLLKEIPDMVLNKHLRHLYDPDGQTRVTAVGLGRELSRAGVKSINGVPSAAFGSQRFYVLRNADKWLNASPQAVRDYVDHVYAKAKK